MGKITDFFRRLLHYPIKKKEVVHEPIELAQHKKGSQQQMVMEHRRLLYGERCVVGRPGRQAAKQDISKFMKHGRQASWYRKSVKEQKKPEEE
jgi:hypothetical protein